MAIDYYKPQTQAITPTYFNERRKTKTFASFSAFKSLRFRKSSTINCNGATTVPLEIGCPSQENGIRSGLNKFYAGIKDAASPTTQTPAKILKSTTTRLREIPETCCTTNDDDENPDEDDNSSRVSSEVKLKTKKNGSHFLPLVPLFFRGTSAAKNCRAEKSKNLPPNITSVIKNAGKDTARHLSNGHAPELLPNGFHDNQTKLEQRNSRSFTTHLNGVILLPPNSNIQVPVPHIFTTGDASPSLPKAKEEFLEGGRNSAEPRLNFWVNRKGLTPNLANPSTTITSLPPIPPIIIDTTNFKANETFVIQSTHSSSPGTGGGIEHHQHRHLNNQDKQFSNCLIDSNSCKSSPKRQKFSKTEKIELDSLLREFGDENDAFLPVVVPRDQEINHKPDKNSQTGPCQPAGASGIPSYNNCVPGHDEIFNQKIPRIKTNGSLPRERKLGIIHHNATTGDFSSSPGLTGYHGTSSVQKSQDTLNTNDSSTNLRSVLNLVLLIKQKIFHVQNLRADILREIEREKCIMSKERESEFQSIVKERKEIEEYQTISEEYIKSLERQRDEKVKSLEKLKENMEKVVNLANEVDSNGQDQLKIGDPRDGKGEEEPVRRENIEDVEETAQLFEDTEFQIFELESKIEEERERIRKNLLEQKGRFTRKYQYIIQEKFTKIDSSKLDSIKQMQTHLELLNEEEGKLKRFIQKELQNLGIDENHFDIPDELNPIPYNLQATFNENGIIREEEGICNNNDNQNTFSTANVDADDEILRRRASEEIRKFWKNISTKNDDPLNTTYDKYQGTTNQRRRQPYLCAPPPNFIAQSSESAGYDFFNNSDGQMYPPTSQSRLNNFVEDDLRQFYLPTKPSPPPNLDVKIEQVTRSLNQIKLQTTARHPDYSNNLHPQKINNDFQRTANFNNNNCHDNSYLEELNSSYMTDDTYAYGSAVNRGTCMSISSSRPQRQSSRFSPPPPSLSFFCHPPANSNFLHSSHYYESNGGGQNYRVINSSSPAVVAAALNETSSSIPSLATLSSICSHPSGTTGPPNAYDQRHALPLRGGDRPSNQMLPPNPNKATSPARFEGEGCCGGYNSASTLDLKFSATSESFSRPKQIHSLYGTTARKKLPPSNFNALLTNNNNNKPLTKDKHHLINNGQGSTKVINNNTKKSAANVLINGINNTDFLYNNNTNNNNNNDDSKKIVAAAPVYYVSHGYPEDLFHYLINSCRYDLNQYAKSLSVTQTCARGYLYKLGYKLKIWKKRWFVFDMSKRHISYYVDKSEQKPKGVIYFQAIEEVYPDHASSYKPPVHGTSFCLKTFQKLYYLCSTKNGVSNIWGDVFSLGIESNTTTVSSRRN